MPILVQLTLRTGACRARHSQRPRRRRTPDILDQPNPTEWLLLLDLSGGRYAIRGVDRPGPAQRRPGDRMNKPLEALGRPPAPSWTPRSTWPPLRRCLGRPVMSSCCAMDSRLVSWHLSQRQP